MSNPNDTTYFYDQEEVKCHIKIMKWTGVIGIILVSLSTPLYILASMEWSNYYPFDYVMEVIQTACSYLKQFDLKDNVILSVCNREIMLGIRLFLNQMATIRGIPLNLNNGTFYKEYPIVSQGTAGVQSGYSRGTVRVQQAYSGV